MIIRYEVISLTIRIEKLQKKVNVQFNGDRVSVHSSLEQAIDEFWEKTQKKHPEFFNGDVFVIASIEENEKEINITTRLAEFKYYLYCEHRGWSCPVFYTCALIESKDGFYLLGEMGDHTQSPRVVQCVGGAADKKDFCDGILDLEQNMDRECQEELGFSLKDPQYVHHMKPAYYKTESLTGNTSVIFKVWLNITADDCMKQYLAYTAKLKKQNQLPEFRSLVWIPKNLEAINRFFQQDQRVKKDYLQMLLKLDYGYIL